LIEFFCIPNFAFSGSILFYEEFMLDIVFPNALTLSLLITRSGVLS